MGRSRSKCIELKIGDHVFGQNPGDFYSHHGIIVDPGIPNENIEPSVIHYHGNKKFDACIKESSVSEFLDGRDLHVVAYPRRIRKIRDLRHGVRRFVWPEKLEEEEPDIVVDRALKMLGEEKYNILFHNCEHFAMFAKCGEKRSVQVENIVEGTLYWFFFGRKKKNKKRKDNDGDDL